MATKKNAKVMSKEELIEKLEEEKAVKKSKKSSAKKPVEKALKVTKKATKKAEEPVEEKKPAKKTVTKTSAAKKATAKKAEKKENPMDKMFPASIEVEGTTFERHEEVKSWEEFRHFAEAMMNAGTRVVLASHWPKKYAKNYNDNNNDKLFPKNGFEYDLDLSEVLMIQQTREIAITVSILTESVILFLEESFELTDFGYFMTNAMPFMVYTYEDAE